MPPRTFTIALDRHVERKQRLQRSRWHDVCIARVRDVERNAKAERLARSIAERHIVLSQGSREHIVRILMPYLTKIDFDNSICQPLSTPREVRLQVRVAASGARRQYPR